MYVYRVNANIYTRPRYEYYYVFFLFNLCERGLPQRPRSIKSLSPRDGRQGRPSSSTIVKKCQRKTFKCHVVVVLIYYRLYKYINHTPPRGVCIILYANFRRYIVVRLVWTIGEKRTFLETTRARASRSLFVISRIGVSKLIAPIRRLS